MVTKMKKRLYTLLHTTIIPHDFRGGGTGLVPTLIGPFKQVVYLNFNVLDPLVGVP